MVAALLLMVGVGVRSFVDGRREAEATQWVAHSHEVLENLHSLLSGIGTAESSLRGYSLSGDPTILDDVVPAMTMSKTALLATSALVVGNPEQSARVAALAPLVAQRLALMNAHLDEIQRGQRPPFSPVAQALSEALRENTNTIIARERALLATRTRDSEAMTVMATWTFPLALLVAVILLLIVFSVLSLEMKHRRRSEAAVRARLDEMRLLGRMNELLASCRQVTEAYDVVSRLAPGLFVDVGGSVSLFRASRDLLARHASWGEAATAELFAPDTCWCLRRGQLHKSGGKGNVSCAHFGALNGEALCVPLLAHGEVIGTLQLVASAGAVIDDDLARIAAVVAESVALAVANLQLRETLRNQSLRDPLTGLFNRRYTEETFARELGRALRLHEPVSLLMLDVDHFKRFNDTFGHDAGDLVLKEIAGVLTHQTRGSDVAARLGGEELCVLLPGATTVDAEHRAEEIRKAIAAITLRHQGKILGRVMTSIGVATAPDHATDVDELMRMADAALYRAKHDGRDRVVVA